MAPSAYYARQHRTQAPDSRICWPATGPNITSRRGNCYDNAHAESFWSRLKTKRLDGGRFPGLAEAKLKIGHYIAYHNAERRHSALAYQSPNRFETHLQTTSQFCPA